MPQPVVSTIIPAYNAGRFVAKAIDSALIQDLPQQIIVIDDGSTDDTADVVCGYAAAVDLLQQPNAGVSAARNRGIAAARGDFIAFLDADDMWMPGKLKAQLDLFAADPALGTVICDELHVTADGEVVRPSFLASRRCHAQLPRTPGRLAKPLTWLVTEPLVPTSGVLTRREVLARAGGFDTSLSICEDRDLWLRLALQEPIGLVPEVLVRYLIGRTDSLSTIVTHQRWAEARSSVLRRHQRQIEAAVRAEGEAPRALMGEVFGELGDAFWYADQMGPAAAAYGEAMRYGAFRRVGRWVAARTRTAALLRRIKQSISA